MRITIVCDVLGVANNGTSLAAYNLIKTLKEKGHDIRVLCPDKEKESLEGFYVVPTINFGPLNNYVKKNGVSLAKKDEIVIENACKGADVVHIMMPFLLGISAMKYCRANDIPVSAGFHVQAENVTSHLFLMNVAPANKFTYRFMWKHFYRYCYSIHFPTKFISDYVKRYGIKAPNEYVISNGVTETYVPYSYQRIKQWEDKFIILMSGRYTKEKRQILLLKAVNKSKYKHKIQLIFCGTGPQKKRLEKYASKHFKNNYPLFELCDKNRLHELICISDLYVHTSKVEIEAISCLEAISSGKVPLISNSPKSATSKFALIPESQFKYNSLKDLRKKIEWWIDNPKRIEEVTPLYLEFVQQFRYKSCMDQMEKMFIEIYQKYEREKEKRK